MKKTDKKDVIEVGEYDDEEEEDLARTKILMCIAGLLFEAKWMKNL
jgi:hypothetical protein